MSFFFEPLSPSSLVANAVLQIQRRLEQLPLATSDGVPAQPCNPGEFGSATTTLLSGEEGDIESSALFVKSSDQLIDQAMLFSNCTLGTALTVWTTTVMNNFCHETQPLQSSTRGQGYYRQKRSSYFATAPAGWGWT